MDFFSRQDRARQQTRLLVFYFIAAVVLILVALNLIAIAAINVGSYYSRAYTPDQFGQPIPDQSGQDTFWRGEVLAFVTIGTLAVIVGGSLYKIAQLSSGGRAVAELMGAMPVLPNTTDPSQRVLRNVVEEMAIASGVPVPAIYVLPGEQGINAFAAGFAAKDAVVCVTQGCLTRLTRDELQGVVAHEFSHILNGDVRLDLRLVGLLYGILLIGLIGYGLLRSAAWSRSSDDDRDGRGQLVLLGVGAGVMAIGFIGLFFGRLIQAAVCRQREFLADAAAVQFTRNAGGLAGALKKLGAIGSGSRVNNHDAEQIAHMFFASSLGIEWGWFATHPPIGQRIKALDPSWDGKFPPREGPTTLERYDGSQVDRQALGPGLPVAAAAVVGSMGVPMPRHITWASDFLTSIPPLIDQAARDPFSARALAFVLLLSEDPSVRQKQLDLLRQGTDAGTFDAVCKLMGPVGELGARARRALLDLALPALRHLSGPQCEQFRRAVRALIEADGRVSLFEYMLHKILAKTLAAPTAAPDRPQGIYYAIKPLMEDVEVLLSGLALADGKDAAAVQAAFRAGAARLGTDEPLSFRQSVDLKAVDAALNHLMLAAPGVKRRVVDACAYCVAADGMVQTEEGELLRAITTTLDCPLPPLLAEGAVVGQPA